MALVLNGTDGSVSVPAMQGSTAGTSTGMYFPATNQAAIATNGTIGLLVDETQTVRINGASASTADSKLNTQITSAGTQITLAELRNLDYTATTKSFLRVRNAVNSSGSTYSSYFGQGADGKTYIIANNGGRGGDIIIDGNNGYVTMPSQPVFEAYLQGGSAISLPQGTNVLLTYNNTQTNISSSYSTTTGRFTAPVAGFYQFNAQALLSKTDSTRIDIKIYKNGSIYIDAEYQGLTNNVTNITAAGAWAFSLAASDYVQVYVAIHGGTSTGSVYITEGKFNRFSGFLVA